MWKYLLQISISIKPIRDGGGETPAPYQFSSVTSRNVGISAENFLTFIFNPFATLVWNFMPHLCEISSLYLVPDPNYWTLTKTTPQKSDFSGQILIKLSLWYTRVTKLWSHDYI